MINVKHPRFEIVTVMDPDFFANVSTLLDENGRATVNRFAGEPNVGRALEVLEPLTAIILERESRVTRISFNMRQDDLAPGMSQQERSWHRDPLDLTYYSLANHFSTQFGRFRRLTPPDGAVTRFKRAEHRSPPNPTNEVVKRLWIGVIVRHHKGWF